MGYNARVNMEFLGPPENIIAGFAPELYGKPLEDDAVVNTRVTKKDDETYYQWDLTPHRLVVATATGNRVRIPASEFYIANILVRSSQKLFYYS